MNDLKQSFERDLARLPNLPRWDSIKARSRGSPACSRRRSGTADDAPPRSVPRIGAIAVAAVLTGALVVGAGGRCSATALPAARGHQPRRSTRRHRRSSELDRIDEGDATPGPPRRRLAPALAPDGTTLAFVVRTASGYGSDRDPRGWRR